MLDRLAIIVVGKPNSGKTTTLKHFCNTYNYEEVSIFREGWRHGIMPFRDKYKAVKIITYFIPSSRTEKAVPLEKIMKGLEWHPDLLLMAEQLNGAEYKNTVDYLRQKDYKIIEFTLEDSNTDSLWHYYDVKDEATILKHRTEQIADCIRSFILSRI